MATTILPLIEPTQIAATATSYYRAGVVTRVDKMTVSNPGNAPTTVTLFLVPSTGSAGATTTLVNARSINTNESWDVWPFIGQVLAVGDAIYAEAGSAATLNLFAAGTQVSG